MTRERERKKISNNFSCLKYYYIATRLFDIYFHIKKKYLLTKSNINKKIFTIFIRRILNFLLLTLPYNSKKKKKIFIYILKKLQIL